VRFKKQTNANHHVALKIGVLVQLRLKSRKKRHSLHRKRECDQTRNHVHRRSD